MAPVREGDVGRGARGPALMRVAWSSVGAFERLSPHQIRALRPWWVRALRSASNVGPLCQDGHPMRSIEPSHRPQ